MSGGLWMDVFGGFITKEFLTLKQANRYESTLRKKYKTVKMTGSPRSGESGRYEWHVCE